MNGKNNSESKDRQVSGNFVEKEMLNHRCFSIWEMGELEKCAPERREYQKNARSAAVSRVRWENVVVKSG